MNEEKLAQEVFKPECGKGWANRCANAKRPICRCKCRGRNHGNPAARNTGGINKRYQVPAEEHRPDLHGKIAGIRINGRPVVYYDGHWLDPAPSISIVNHSPDGFEWGYAGSGCAQLALAICLKWLSREEALAVYQTFKFETIAPMERSNFELNLGWVKGRLNELAIKA